VETLMRVQMKTKIGGYRDGVEWPQIGGTIDVPDHEAAGLIGNGYAQLVEDDDAGQAESAPTDGPDEEAADGSDQPAPASDSDNETADEQGDAPDGGADAADTAELTDPARAAKSRKSPAKA
jgi:hypothetical protein